MPDLAVVITMALAGNRPLFGLPPADVLDPVPPEYLRTAILYGIPGLLQELETDTRSVLLTFARIWTTLETGPSAPRARPPTGRLPGSR